MRTAQQQALIELYADIRGAILWIETGAEPAVAIAALKKQLERHRATVEKAVEDSKPPEHESKSWKGTGTPGTVTFVAGRTPSSTIQISYTG